MISTNILYHVSFDPVKKFDLRVPKSRCPGEDKKTPRICFSERMELAVSSMPQGGQALRGMLNLKGMITPILHCYMCADWEQPHGTFLPPDKIKNKVGDAEGTREWWAIKIPKVNHVIMQVFDATFKESTDKFGNSGVIVTSIDHDVIHELPRNAPEIFFKNGKSYSMRTLFSVADGMKFKE